PRTCQSHTAFALNRLDEHASDAPRTPDDIGTQVRALRVHECVQVLARLGQELVRRVHLAPVNVLALVSWRQPPSTENLPYLFQASLLAARRLLGGAGFLDRKGDVRPVERWESQSRVLAVRHGKTAQRANVKGPFERPDEAAVTVFRG